MRRAFLCLGLAGAGLLLAAPAAFGACCSFSALGPDVNEPAQKSVVREKADDPFQWLTDNRESCPGDEATLDYYIGKKWFFTVMKIDPMQMKKQPDGSFTGEITPTRSTFASPSLVYPLRITSISV